VIRVRRFPVRSPLRAAAAALAALALAVTAATLAPLSASASATASVSGVVTAGDTGAPLADLAVTLMLPGGTQVSTTSTDSSGTYTFADLQAANYVEQFSDDYSTGHLGTTTSAFKVNDGQTVTGVNVVLALGGSITGTVSLSTGPLTQPATVALVRQGAVVNGPGDLFGIGTAPDGTFTLTGVKPGSYTLYFSGPNGADVAPQFWSGASSLATASYFTVTAGQTAAGKDAVLQPGSSVSGTVTAGGTGAPLSFAFVQALNADGSVVSGTSTASDGTYTLSGLAPGSLTLEVLPPFNANLLTQWWSGSSSQSDAQYFDVPAGGALTGYNTQLPIGATISGTITDDAGNPIPFASAYALKAGNVYSVGGFADGSGDYTISALTAGDYTVSFDASGSGSYATGWWNGATSPSAANVIHLGDQQQVTGIDSALGAGATISGTVTGLTTDGTSFLAANATITAVRADGSQAGQAYANWDGTYTIGNLPAGTYFLQIDPQGDTTDFSSQWYLNHSSLATATPITVTADETLSGTDITLAAAVTLPKLTTSTPKISGAPRVGNTVTARPGAWGPKPVSFTYQWLRSGVPIPGATKDHYRAVQADAGTTLTVSVTGSKKGYASATVASAPTALVTGGKLTGVTPTISGTPRSGNTLTAVVGNWTPAPVTLAIQWYRDGNKISGATGTSYVITAIDRDRKLTVAVTGSKPGFTSATEKSRGVKVAR
jgi:carboxypeptidase family protein